MRGSADSERPAHRETRYAGSVFDSRSRLEAERFDSIDAMIRAYSDEAVVIARGRHRMHLDYAPASIDTLETLLEQQAAVDLEFQSRLWGSYFGEVLRRRWDGHWLLAPYPGTAQSALGPEGRSAGVQAEAAVPTLEVRGSRLWPTLKVYRRLTLGASENLKSFYALVDQRLGPPPPVQ